MNVSPITPAVLSRSVIAVPPLARNQDLSISRDQNAKIIRHLEAGGVTTLLYGGNAVLYHVAPSEYAPLLEMLTELAGDQTLVIPSVGPSFGLMMDQAQILKEFNFPTAMILPQREVCTPRGVASAVRHFVERLERPAVLYIKHDGFIDVPLVKQLMDDRLLSWIKYAIVRDKPSEDTYLRSLADAVGPERIVSGIGEQPAPDHLRGFGLSGFTSGCVCIAPRLSMEMLDALKSGDLPRVEEIRQIFQPLEDLRNAINPIRVLHTAIRLAGIADTGPLAPLLSDIEPAECTAIEVAAHALAAAEQVAAGIA
jgi:dihydrodipicolinate synthase/N-acetylneuraminate lyase